MYAPMDIDEMRNAMERAAGVLSGPYANCGVAPCPESPTRAISPHYSPWIRPLSEWVATNGLDNAFLLVACNEELTRWHMHFWTRNGGMSIASMEVMTTPAEYEWTFPY